MHLLVRLSAIALLGIGMTVAVIDNADARRLGGGRIFSKSWSKPSSSFRSPARQAKQRVNQKARQQFTQRGGLMGMLGGLALGGLLGALFFGGAFENLNMFDFILFALIAYILYRVFRVGTRMRSRLRSMPGANNPGGNAASATARPRYGAYRTRTSDSPEAFAPGAANTGRTDRDDADFDDEQRTGDQRPADFDAGSFLAGAKSAYHQLQKAWNDKDMNALRELATDAMFSYFQDQARAADADFFVEVLKVDAELIGVRQTNHTQEASVQFHAVLRESPNQQPTQVREIWNFTRDARSQTPTWFLDSIENSDNH